MKLGMVTHWYDPEGGAAAGPGTMARALRDRGHEVHVVTGFPIYPAGTVFDGYRIRPYLREVRDGVTVHRAPIYPSHDTRALHRAGNYASFAASGSAVAARVLRGVDATFVYSTPATAAAPALVAKALWGTPFVVQIQDLWPQSVTSSGLLSSADPGRVDQVLHRFCDRVYRSAATIAVTAPGMAALIAARGMSTDKITLLPNWADEASFRPVPPDPDRARRLGLSRPFIVMYAGNFGELQSLHTVVAAAQRLRARTDIGFALVGAGVTHERLRAQVHEARLDNVTFVPPQPFAEMAQILALGSVQLICLKDVPLLRSTLPSKLQANMAAGRPVIGAVAGDAADIIRRAEAGLVVPPEDDAALADAVRQMADLSPAELAAAGLRAREHYVQHFSERVVGDQLSDLLIAAAAGRGARRGADRGGRRGADRGGRRRAGPGPGSSSVDA